MFIQESKKFLKDRQPSSMPWEREMLCLSYTFLYLLKIYIGHCLNKYREIVKPFQLGNGGGQQCVQVTH